MYAMHVLYGSIYNAPLLQPKQSQVCARRPNRKDVSLAYYRSVSVNVGSRSDGGREFHSFGAQVAKLRGPKLKCGRLALVDRHEQQRIGGGDLY